MKLWQQLKNFQKIITSPTVLTDQKQEECDLLNLAKKIQMTFFSNNNESKFTDNSKETTPLLVNVL